MAKAEELSPGAFMEQITKAGLVAMTGTINPRNELTLTKVVEGDVQAKVAGVYEEMEQWLARVPLDPGWQKKLYPIGRRDYPNVDADKNIVGFTVMAWLGWVLPRFLEEVGGLAERLREAAEERIELIQKFNAKVKEEVDSDLRVIAVREKISWHEAEGRRLGGDLVAIREELRAERAGRLEQFLYVTDEREL
jgi:hypothetical protein